MAVILNPSPPIPTSATEPILSCWPLSACVVSNSATSISAALISHLSAYVRQHNRQFGRCVLDMEDKPRP